MIKFMFIGYVTALVGGLLCGWRLYHLMFSEENGAWKKDIPAATMGAILLFLGLSLAFPS